MARKILLTSFKGGTGVTTCCLGLGLAFAEAGERSLIVDGDRYSGNAMTMAGCGNMQVYTLEDYSNGACRAKQTLVRHPSAPNLNIMSALNLKDASAAERAVNDLDELFDYILCDRIAASVCEEALIVTEPFLPSIKSADCCRSALADGGIEKLSLIINKLNGGQILNGDTMTAQEIAAILHLELKAVIPEDLTLSSGKCKTATKRAFSLAADCIAGRRGDVCDVLKGYTNPAGYFKRKMREMI